MKQFVSLFCFLSALIFFSPSSLSAQSNLSKELQADLALQERLCPEEKVYVQTDRTIYKQSETIWLAAYLLGPDQQENSSISAVLKVDLLNPAGTVASSLQLLKGQGAFYGDIIIPANWPGGIYTLKAYTNHQGNFDEEWVFEKEITIQAVTTPLLLMTMDFEREAYGAGDTVRAFVDASDLLGNPLQNENLNFQLKLDGTTIINATTFTNNAGAALVEAILPKDLTSADLLLAVKAEKDGRVAQVSRRPKVVLNNIQLRFYAEGGDWVAALPAQLAFKAKDQWGKPVDVEGHIKDKNGHIVTDFRSLHDGMGKVNLSAETAWPLTASITKPLVSEKPYPLPNPVAGQWQIGLTCDNDDELCLQANSLVDDELSVVVRMYNKVHLSQTLTLDKGKNSFELAVSDLPKGIAQITVFDRVSRPIWERLVFLHPDRNINVSIETDEEQYLPRSLVEMTLEVKDEAGKPLAGNFSASVVNDALHTFADDKQANIQAQLLLCSELRGEVYEPNFYFDETEENRLAALDLLMMTNGWRRFPWRQLQGMKEKDWEELAVYDAEKVTFKGNVYLQNQPISGAKVVLPKTGYLTETKSDGSFEIPLREAAQGDAIEVRYKGIQYAYQVYHQGVNRAQNAYRPGELTLASTSTIVQAERQPLGIEREMKEEIMPMDQEFAVNEPQKRAMDMDQMNDGLFGLDDEAWGEQQQLDEVVITAMGANRQAISMQSAITTVSGELIAVTEYNDDLNLDVDLADQIPSLYVRYAQGNQGTYYQSRQFAFPQYQQQSVRENSTPDLRKTIYWNPSIQVNEKGEAKVSFYTADEMTSYRILLEGIAETGMIVHKEETFAVAPPVSIQLDLPEYVTTGDQLSIPVRIQNMTKKKVNISLDWLALNGIEKPADFPSSLQLEAGEVVSYKLKSALNSNQETLELALKIHGRQWEETIRREIAVQAKGFPTSASLSGSKSQGVYQFDIESAVPNSIKAELQLFADVEGELLAGAESMFRQPSGCFEQTSSTNYPNIMVLNYLEKKNNLDKNTRQSAWSYLENGYNRLAGYEVQGGGFSLWGQAPASPILTAYGLMQFHDLDKVWPNVSPEMLVRTNTWLEDQFKQYFSGSIDDGYILYALSSTSSKRWNNKLAIFTKEANNSNEAYALALSARLNYLYNNEKAAAEALEKLLEMFDKDQFASASQTPSLSHSRGQSVPAEVVSWTILAALEQGKSMAIIQPMMQFLSGKRTGGGRFGSTPASVRALDAITCFEAANSHPKEAGELWMRINGQVLDSIAFNAESPATIVYNDLGQYFKEGRNIIEMGYVGVKHPLPYSLEVGWETYVPPTHKEAPLAIHQSLSHETIPVGETVRYAIDLENTEHEEGYAPMLLLSAPAGLSWQPWQLKEMQEQRVFDYYEISDEYLVLYFGSIAAKGQKNLRFDLVANFPGEFQAPASAAYLYYFDEAKTWTSGAKIIVTE